MKNATENNSSYSPSIDTDTRISNVNPNTAIRWWMKLNDDERFILVQELYPGKDIEDVTIRQGVELYAHHLTRVKEIRQERANKVS